MLMDVKLAKGYTFNFMVNVPGHGVPRLNISECVWKGFPGRDEPWNWWTQYIFPPSVVEHHLVHQGPEQDKKQRKE